MIVRLDAWHFRRAEPISSFDVNGSKRCIVNQPHSPSKITDTPASSGAAANERSVLLRGNRLDSTDLFIDSRELMIAHGDDVYRLRLTAQNKLILTK